MNNIKTPPMIEDDLVIVRAWVALLRKLLLGHGIKIWLRMDKRLWILTLRAGTGDKPTYQLKVYAPAIAKWDEEKRLQELSWYVTEFKSIFGKRD